MKWNNWTVGSYLGLVGKTVYALKWPKNPDTLIPTGTEGIIMAICHFDSTNGGKDVTLYQMHFSEYGEVYVNPNDIELDR